MGDRGVRSRREGLGAALCPPTPPAQGPAESLSALSPRAAPVGSVGCPPISPRAKFTLLIRTRLTSDFAFLLLVLCCWWLGPSAVIVASPFGGWWLSNHRVFLLWPERRCPWANRGFWKVLPGWRRGAFHAMCSCFWAAPAPGSAGGGLGTASCSCPHAEALAPSHLPPPVCPLPVLVSASASRPATSTEPWMQPGSLGGSSGTPVQGSRGGSKQSRPRAVRPGE